MGQESGPHVEARKAFWEEILTQSQEGEFVRPRSRKGIGVN